MYIQSTAQQKTYWILMRPVNKRPEAMKNKWEYQHHVLCTWYGEPSAAEKGADDCDADACQSATHQTTHGTAHLLHAHALKRALMTQHVLLRGQK